MKTVFYLFLVLFIDKTTAGIFRKPPAFATPVYSDAYLPAAMQVIFHAVDQLKHIQLEEAEQNVSPGVSTSPHPPGQHQPLPSHHPTASTPSATTPIAIVPDGETPEINQEMSVMDQEMPEVNQERPEKPYATTEVNNEKPEIVHGTPESNHEEPEVNHEMPEVNRTISPPGNDNDLTVRVDSDSGSDETIPLLIDVKIDDETTTTESVEVSQVPSTSESSITPDTEVTPNIDSVVQGIYGIVRPNSSSNEKSDESEECSESKNSSEESYEDSESYEDQEDETRFGLLGERVVQVPRPSLMGYLLRVGVPANQSLRQLAGLYDALSKDARIQGFAKFSGYSDPVLKDLEATAGGGVGPQIKLLLEKAAERKELTRDDAKEKVKKAIMDLGEPGSVLSTDLRRLLPLRFMP